MSQRLISADDHIDLSHGRVKSFLDPSFHSSYDDAVHTFLPRWAAASRRGEPALASATGPGGNGRR